jgi:hypothetical protein
LVAVYLLVFKARFAVMFPSPMALGLRSVLEQPAAVRETSSPLGAEVNDGNLDATRTAPQVFSCTCVLLVNVSVNYIQGISQWRSRFLPSY